MGKKTTELTQKEKRQIDWYWQNLYEVFYNKGCQASAGEVARHMGISRETAKKQLDKMAKLGIIASEEYRHNAKVKATGYSIIGKDD